MNFWYQAYHKWFTEEDCQKIVQLGKTFKPKDATIFEGKGKIDNSIRRSTVRWLSRFEPRCFTLFHTVKALFEEANAQVFGFDLTHLSEIQFTEYHAEVRGKYGWHRDLMWVTKNSQIQRKLSMVVQLSKPEDYEGGKLELNFEEKDIALPDKMLDQGSVIMFPAFVLHRVTPVTKGTRYSLVSWHSGPPFR